MNYLFYHYPCLDGFAAYVWIRLYNEIKSKDPWEYIPLSHGMFDQQELWTKYTSADTLLFVDSCPTQKIFDLLRANNVNVQIIDHHKGATVDISKELRDSFLVFDETKSGALLAFEYFKGTFYLGKDLESMFNCALLQGFFELISNHDTWKYDTLPDHEQLRLKAFTAGLASYPKDYSIWKDILSNWGNHEGADICAQGNAILRRNQVAIEELLVPGNISYFQIAGWKIPVVNCTDRTIYSDVGHQLAKNHPFSAVYYMSNSGPVFSLRSNNLDPDAIDVSLVARLYGSNGHPNASGFRIGKLKDLSKVTIKHYNEALNKLNH